VATVGSPRKIFHILSCFSQLLGFAALAVEEPDLFFAFVAFGEESEELAVGTPARMLGGDAFGGHGEGFAAGGGDHPDAGFVLVSLERSFVDRVGDPLAVWAKLGVVDGLDLEVVVDGDGSGSGGLGGREERITKRREAEYAETEKRTG